MSFILFPDRNREPPAWALRLAAAQERLFLRPFPRALRISLITIHALILREATTRYGRKSAGYVWALVQPLMQLGAMIAIFTFLGRVPAVGDSLVVFFMTGIVPLIALRQGLSRSANAVNSNRALMTYPQVRGFEVMTARVILELLTNFCVMVVVMLFMKAFTGLPLTAWIDAPLELIQALAALTLLIYGASFLSAQLGRVSSVWGDIVGAMGRVLFFTSGLWYTLGSLPPAVRDVIRYNPLAHMIEWIRDAAIPGFESNHFHPMYPITFGVCCLFLGLFIEWLYRISQFDLDGGRS